MLFEVSYNRNNYFIEDWNFNSETWPKENTFRVIEFHPSGSLDCEIFQPVEYYCDFVINK